MNSLAPQISQVNFMGRGANSSVIFLGGGRIYDEPKLSGIELELVPRTGHFEDGSRNSAAIHRKRDTGVLKKHPLP